MRIRSLLVLMAIAILLRVVLAAGVALDPIREGERAAALRGLRETARATSLIVGREVQGSLAALKALSHSRLLQGGDLHAFHAEAGAINQLTDVWTLLIDEKGPADPQMTMADLLRMYGYEVFEVAEGNLAHAAVLELQPNAVVMDIGLPDMDGYRVARCLREDPATRHVPLIALTGYGQSRDKEQAATVGFDAHLTKPVVPDDLIAAIEAVVDGAAQAQG